MAKQSDIAHLLDKFEPRLKDAFLAAIREIVSKARIAEIVRSLERGEIQGAVEALYVDEAAFRIFEREIGHAFETGGISTIEGLGELRDPRGGRFVVRFNVRNPRAEAWLSEHSSFLVTRIAEEQRIVVRQHLVSGMEAGRNPRSVALDVVGRINRTTGRREGGVVGLSHAQEDAVRRARRDLQNGNYGDYLSRTRRDKRFDRTIQRAIKEGKPLTGDQITKIVNRYADSLLKLRGETISRTEALASLHAAQYEALRQLVDTGKVTASQVRRVWDSASDFRVRPSHRAADGQSVGLDEDFVMPSGARMRYPGDPRGGPAEVVNCRCNVKVRIDFLANVR